MTFASLAGWSTAYSILGYYIKEHGSKFGRTGPANARGEKKYRIRWLLG